MKRESITALRWYFLNCSVTQFYWVQVFSSPKYIHVSEESSTNLLLINKLLLTKDEGPNSYKQYLRGCRTILSQIFSFLPPPPPAPFPPAASSSSAPSCTDAEQRSPSSSWDQHPQQWQRHPSLSRSSQTRTGSHPRHPAPWLPSPHAGNGPIACSQVKFP